MRLLSGPNFSYFATIAHPCIHIQIEPKRKKFGNSDGRKQLKYLLSEVIKIFGAIRKKYFRFYSDEEAFCQMYHMCVAEASGTFKKFSFLCPNGSLLQPPCNLIELLQLWRYNLQPGEAGVWRLVQCRLFRGHHRQRRLRPRPARRWENLHHSRVGVWRAGEGLPVEIQKWLVLRCQMKEKDLEMKQLFKIKLQISSYHKLLDTENSIVIQSEM